MKYNPKIVEAYFRECNIPAPVFEHRFHPTRKWRFDLSWPDHKLALDELINEIATRFITHLMYSGGEFDPEVLMDKLQSELLQSYARHYQSAR